MLNVSSSLPDIAVIRGGNDDFEVSLEEGKDILKSLSKLSYRPLDVIVDREGHWTVQGMPTDAHAIFTRAHTVIDTTRDARAPHISLARKMGITLMFSRGAEVKMDREDMYRLLRMQGFKVPDTIVVRAQSPLRDSLFREVWATYHTPLMIRPLVRTKEVESRLITMYPEFEEAVREYHKKGIDIHILTYRKAPVSSLAILPQFRGEGHYVPLWVETFDSIGSIPGPHSKTRVYFNAPDFRKEQIKKVAKDVYVALDLKGPACIDLIPYEGGYIVVNIETNPSLRKDGRFMQSLGSTGVDIGQYIHSQIKDEFVNQDLSSLLDQSTYDYAR